MKDPGVWSDDWQERFRRICSARWGFRYRADDAFTLRDLVDRAYQASDVDSVGAFAELLETLPDSDPEIQAFVSRMAVGETSFFRNQPQFEALATQVLPGLIDARTAASDLRLRVWSAGCSSGEEPYSIAILLAELIPDWQQWDIRILGTDLNPFALRRAGDALYSEWSFRETDPEILARYFKRVAKLWRLDHPCRAMVSLRRLNLATDPIPDAELGIDDLDLILCRNVTIYFDRALTERLAQSFFETLAPGGWLIVGHTEPDTQTYDRFEVHEFPDTIVYRVPSTTPAPTSPSANRPGSGPLTPSGTFEPIRRNQAAPTVDEAMVAYEAHDLDSAFEMLHIIARDDSIGVIAPHLLAQISADERRYDEALYWAFSALQRDAFHVPTLMLMGLVFLERGDPERAKLHLQQALFNDATCPEAHLYLGLVHRALGRADLAERSRARAVRLASEHQRPPGALLPVERARLSIASEP